VRIENLDELLGLYYSRFLDTSYKENFPWIDHISKVKDSDLIETLDTMVIEMIRNKDFSRCWLAAPTTTSWLEIGAFRYGKGSRSGEHFDLDLKDFVDETKHLEKMDKAKLSTKRVLCVSAEGYDMDSWSLYDCLYSELDYTENSFILTGGSWYKVAADYVIGVNNYFDSIPLPSGELPSYNDEKEGDYNDRVVREGVGRLALLD